MAKKHWIYIKRGLSEDAKHRAAMGECIWLFMHIIDRADWETGIAFDWKDKEEAADMGMPVDTLRAQRAKLEDGDYIRCKQKQHCQDIKIMEWRNPRDYSSEVKNPRNEGSNEALPSDFEGLNQGSSQGSSQVPSQIKTPSLDSKSKSLPDKTYNTFSKKVTDERREMLMLSERITASLGITPDLADRNWEKTIRQIVRHEEGGQRFEGFVKWLKSGNDYNRPKTFQLAKNPKLILTLWAQAFMSAVEQATFTRNEDGSINV